MTESTQRYNKNIISILSKRISIIKYECSMQYINNYFERIDLPNDFKWVDYISHVMDEMIDCLYKVIVEIDDKTLNTWKMINVSIQGSSSELKDSKIELYIDTVGQDKKSSISNVGDAAEIHADNKTKVLVKDRAINVYGNYMSNPLFSVICTSPSDNKSKKYFNVLKAIFFLIYPIICELSREINPTSKYPYSVSLVVQKLSEPFYRQTLYLLPDEMLTVKEYQEHLDCIINNENDEVAVVIASSKDELVKINNALKYTLKLKQFPGSSSLNKEGHGKGGGEIRGVIPGDEYIQHIDTLILDDDEDYDEIQSYQITELPNNWLDNKDINKSNKKHDLLVLFPRIEDYLNIDPSIDALRQNGLINAIAMKNQHLAIHRQNLSLIQIGDIFSYISSNKFTILNQRFELETFIIFLMLIYYGRSINDIFALKMVDDSSRELGNECCIAYIQDEERIKIKIYTDKNKTALTEMQKDVVEEKSLYITLPTPKILSLALEQLCSLAGLSTRTSIRLFSGSPEQYQSAINRKLKNVTSTSFTYVALTRILFNKLLENGGDIAEAIMLTGQTQGNSKSRLSYTDSLCQNIESMYIETMNNMVNEISYEFYFSIDATILCQIPEFHEIQNVHIGTRHVWKDEALQNAVNLLITKINKLKKSNNWQIFHNYYTVYTILLIDYATSGRSITDKYFFDFMFDVINKVVTLSDKDAKDYYNSRIAYLPELCIRQLEQYRIHMRVIAEKVALLSLSDYCFISSRFTQTPTSFDYIKLRKYSNEHCGQFFLFDDKGKIIPVRPKNIHALIKDDFVLPMNANRKYIRTFLLREKCNPEFIDAYMGHWSAGQENAGRYSTISIDEILYEVGLKVDLLVKKIGFKRIKGLTM